MVTFSPPSSDGCAAIVPPWARMMVSQIDSPKPEPPYSRERGLLDTVKPLEKCSIVSSGGQGALSSMHMDIEELVFSAFDTDLPLGVCIALAVFQKIIQNLPQPERIAIQN